MFINKHLGNGVSGLADTLEGGGVERKRNIKQAKQIHQFDQQGEKENRKDS